VPTAVMSWHCWEHSISTTRVPSFPEEVPVTLMSVKGSVEMSRGDGMGRGWDGAEVGYAQCTSEMLSFEGYSAQMLAGVE
jgi:hypothetical protein